jgi:type IV pilus assembly protein PilB
MKRSRLGDTLLSLGAIDPMQLSAALALHRQWGMPLGRAVVEQHFCTPEQVLYALALQTGLGSVDLDRQSLDESLTSLVPRKVAEQHHVVPLRRQGPQFETLVVAIAAPASLASLDAVRSVSRKSRIVPLLATDQAIDRAIRRLYGNKPQDRRPPLPSMPAVPPVTLKPNPVLIFGWPDFAAKSLAVTLAAEGQPARIVHDADVLACGPMDIVVAPLPAMEWLLVANPRFRGRMILAAKRPDVDHPRAARLGAAALLAAPVDPQQLLRALVQLRQEVAQAGRRDGPARA